MRLIDADVFAHNVVKYSHQSTKTIGQALADTPTVDAVPMSVIEDIKAEIIKLQTYKCFEDTEKLVALDEVLQIIDKYKVESEDEK